MTSLQKVLLVEGKDDEHVLKHLSSNSGGPRFDNIVQYDGIPNLLESLPVQIKARGGDATIAIVVDADLDLSARWQSLRGILTRLGYNVPPTPSSKGTIINGPTNPPLPRIGIWVMPDNEANGILEDFVAFLVPPNSPLLGHAKRSIAAIGPADRQFKEVDLPKALIHTWLAWQAEPGRPMGTAITAKYLDHNSSHARDLVSWLIDTFS